MTYTVTKVSSHRDLKRFINLSYHFYQNDPLWVPPLRKELSGQFHVKTNPFLDHCTWQLFLLWRDGVVVGRIAAFIDHLANQAWQEEVGLFGYYECPPDLEASTFLFNEACGWLTGQGMHSIRGPWSFVSQEWGSVIEGFAPPAVVMAPYNPLYYNDHYHSMGLEKIKDLLVYQIDGSSYQIPDRILLLTERIAHRYQISTRSLDMSHLDRDVEKIIELSNASLIENWGYSPVTDAEVRAMVRDLKQIIHPRGVIFAEDAEGHAVGFAIAIPDVNQILIRMNGHLFPTGWYHLLRGLPRLQQYRMFALGVIPEFQGKGVDSLLYRALYESLFSPGFRLEINYVLEDNMPMNNAIMKLGAAPFRRYRVYQMPLNS